jgi:hypothetical protein
MVADQLFCVQYRITDMLDLLWGKLRQRCFLVLFVHISASFPAGS